MDPVGQQTSVVCLGIESSCDETGLALVRDGVLVDQVISSSSDLHALFGGVVPELASREHYRAIHVLFEELMRRTRMTPSDITDIAVSRGPGLLGSLLVGVAFAKALALGLGAHLIGVNHLHAHLLVAGLEHTLTFPAMGLLVSGGHTNIYRMERPDHFLQLGRTIDDAAGEAFDKIGSLLGFPYPAGRLIDACARLAEPLHAFPVPYVRNDTLDFSFSGLKTAVAACISQELRASYERPVRDIRTLPQDVLALCSSFNHAVARTLAIKTDRALSRNPDLRHLVLAGGVAANGIIRETLQELCRKRGVTLLVPSPGLCTDNGAMVACAGYMLARLGLEHDLGLETIPRGRTVPEDLKRRQPVLLERDGTEMCAER